MPPVIVADTYEVVCSGTFTGFRPWAQVWHCKKNGLGLTQAVADIVGEVYRSSYASKASDFVNEWLLSKITVRDIAIANQPAFEYAFTDVPGTDTNDPLPPQLSLVVTLKTALAGRSFRGRKYFNGAGETRNTTAGTPLGAYRDDMVDLVADIRTGLAALGTPHVSVIASRKLGIATEHTSESADLIWDTQRHRGRQP